jgi:Class III cytochrome C family
MRAIAIASLVLAACLQQHATGSDVGDLACASCHMDLYNAQPDHVGGQKPTTCGDCHNTGSWGAAHPEAKFPIKSGAHTGIACSDCHDSSMGSPTAGANTNCIRCHTQTQSDPSHAGVGGYTFDSSKPHFCLTCHPDGKAASHPESPFPIKSGNHVGIACNSCHQASLGSSYQTNFDCYANGACHSVNHNGTSSSPRACFQCHPSGSAGN